MPNHVRESDLVTIMVKGAIVASLTENNRPESEAEAIADNAIVNHTPNELQLRWAMGAALHALRKAGYRVVHSTEFFTK